MTVMQPPNDPSARGSHGRCSGEFGRKGLGILSAGAVGQNRRRSAAPGNGRPPSWNGVLPATTCENLPMQGIADPAPSKTIGPVYRLRLILTLMALSALVSAADGVDRSFETADRLWDQTVNAAGEALDRARFFWREERPQDAGLWEDLIPRLDEVIALQDRQRDLPESAWFGEDQASNARVINGILDEVTRILIGNSQLREAMQRLSAAMAENRAAIVELKRRKLTAPTDSLWRKTVSDLVEEIGERESLLAEQQQAMIALHAQIASLLRDKGLDIDAEGVEFLLSTVVGDDVIDMTLVFAKVRQLTEQLEALTVESQEDLATARRYYGMYVVLLTTLEHMHVMLVDRIGNDYQPRIETIRDRALALRRETQALNRQGPNQVLQSNLDAQQLTIDAAGRYADYLARQQRQVTASLERLRQDLAVARNTYETVKISGDLVALMQNSRERLDSLFQLQVPRLRAFENLEMKREFERLTASIQQQEGLGPSADQ